jgi:glycosyltransferase involved in cell wall biosynthesis
MKLPKKILFWRVDYYNLSPDGGLFTTFYETVKSFNKLGIETVWVHSGPLKKPEGTKYYEIKYSKFLTNLPEIPLIYYNYKSEKELLKIIEIEKPDLIYHFQSFFHYSIANIKKKTNIPVFMQLDGIMQWVKLNWGKTYFPGLLKKMELESWSGVDEFFTVSNFIKEQLNSYGIENNLIHVITSKADTDLFNPNVDGKFIKDKYSPNGPLIGFVGTFGKWHGVEFLIDNAQLLFSKLPNSKLLLVGDGPLRGVVEKKIKENNLTEKIILTGLVDLNEVPKYISACDILVSPCIPNEKGEFINSPVKIFEYLSMGKPLVASDIGQQAEIIKNNENGILFETFNGEDFVNKIQNLISDESLKSKLSLAARKDAILNYDWKFNAEIILSAYQKYIK